jgi:peptide/nickel transport system substrate-binding protein
MRIVRRLATVITVVLILIGGARATAAAADARSGTPTGQMTWAVHISLAPTWFDPAETAGTITSYMVLYALHDAMVKPMPGNPMTPSLAESWNVSPDGLVYEFALRRGARFHNGEPVTAEDVKFSFERYRGSAAKVIKDRVAAVEIPEAGRIRFRLKQAWPDFMTFYANATGSGWVVPKKYLETVGEEGFKKVPIGAGPYKFVSFNPGVELVLEASDYFWRKTPNVKRLVFRVIPDEATRLVALKRGEVDVAYLIRGALAEELRRTPGLTLKHTALNSTFWINFLDQWDPKSPWYDRRVRQAAGLAVNRQAYNQAELLGLAKITGSIIPSGFDFYWPPPPPSYDPVGAKALLAEAGYPNGFDAGDFYADLAFTGPEAVVNDLRAVGLGLKLRPIERAAFMKAFAEKKFKNLMYASSALFGNAATRIESFVASGGMYVYGSYADIDGLFREQAGELERKRREAALHRIQQLVHEKAMFAPLWEPAILSGFGPRVEDAGFGLIGGYPYSAPYEDVRLKGK